MAHMASAPLGCCASFSVSCGCAHGPNANGAIREGRRVQGGRGPRERHVASGEEGVSDARGGWDGVHLSEAGGVGEHDGRLDRAAFRLKLQPSLAHLRVVDQLLVEHARQERLEYVARVRQVVAEGDGELADGADLLLVRRPPRRLHLRHLLDLGLRADLTKLRHGLQNREPVLARGVSGGGGGRAGGRCARGRRRRGRRHLEHDVAQRGHTHVDTRRWRRVPTRAGASLSWGAIGCPTWQVMTGGGPAVLGSPRRSDANCAQHAKARTHGWRNRENTS